MKLNLAAIQQPIVKHRVALIWLVILLLLGSTLVQILSISNPQPDKAYVESRQQSLQTPRINIKDELRAQIDKLEDTRVNVTPGEVGKSNPFSP